MNTTHEIHPAIGVARAGDSDPGSGAHDATAPSSRAAKGGAA